MIEYAPERRLHGAQAQRGHQHRADSWPSRRGRCVRVPHEEALAIMDGKRPVFGGDLLDSVAATP